MRMVLPCQKYGTSFAWLRFQTDDCMQCLKCGVVIRNTVIRTVTGTIHANFQKNNKECISFCVPLGNLPTLATLEGAYRELVTRFNTHLREDGKVTFPDNF